MMQGHSDGDMVISIEYYMQEMLLNRNLTSIQLIDYVSFNPDYYVTSAK